MTSLAATTLKLLFSVAADEDAEERIGAPTQTHTRSISAAWPKLHALLEAAGVDCTTLLLKRDTALDAHALSQAAPVTVAATAVVAASTQSERV